jgi:hypothetical protein
LAPQQSDYDSKQVSGKNKQMGKIRNIGRSSSFVSIPSAPSTQERRDANNHEESHLPVIDVEALRTIRRIVLTIKERIAAGQESRPVLSAGDPRGATDTRSNCSKNTQEEKR